MYDTTRTDGKNVTKEAEPAARGSRGGGSVEPGRAFFNASPRRILSTMSSAGGAHSAKEQLEEEADAAAAEPAGGGLLYVGHPAFPMAAFEGMMWARDGGLAPSQPRRPATRASAPPLSPRRANEPAPPPDRDRKDAAARRGGAGGASVQVRSSDGEWRHLPMMFGTREAGVLEAIADGDKTHELRPHGYRLSGAYSAGHVKRAGPAVAKLKVGDHFVFAEPGGDKLRAECIVLRVVGGPRTCKSFAEAVTLKGPGTVPACLYGAWENSRLHKYTRYSRAWTEAFYDEVIKAPTHGKAVLLPVAPVCRVGSVWIDGKMGGLVTPPPPPETTGLPAPREARAGRVSDRRAAPPDAVQLAGQRAGGKQRAERRDRGETVARWRAAETGNGGRPAVSYAAAAGAEVATATSASTTAEIAAADAMDAEGGLSDGRGLKRPNTSSPSVSSSDSEEEDSEEAAPQQAESGRPSSRTRAALALAAGASGPEDPTGAADAEGSPAAGGDHRGDGEGLEPTPAEASAAAAARLSAEAADLSPVECTICALPFANDKGLKAHLDAAHGSAGGAELAPMGFTRCPAGCKGHGSGLAAFGLLSPAASGGYETSSYYRHLQQYSNKTSLGAAEEHRRLIGSAAGGQAGAWRAAARACVALAPAGSPGATLAAAAADPATRGTKGRADGADGPRGGKAPRHAGTVPVALGAAHASASAAALSILTRTSAPTTASRASSPRPPVTPVPVAPVQGGAGASGATDGTPPTMAGGAAAQVGWPPATAPPAAPAPVAWNARGREATTPSSLYDVMAFRNFDMDRVKKAALARQDPPRSEYKDRLAAQPVNFAINLIGGQLSQRPRAVHGGPGDEAGGRAAHAGRHAQGGGCAQACVPLQRRYSRPAPRRRGVLSRRDGRARTAGGWLGGRVACHA